MRSADISGGTFTLSNLGMYGVDLFTAILTEGQVGILAVGRITDRVVARAGVAFVRPTMQMSLSCDHRKIDGARAAGVRPGAGRAAGESGPGLNPLSLGTSTQ